MTPTEKLIRDLEVGPRAARVLREHHIETVDQLLDLTALQILTTSNVGRKIYNEIRDVQMWLKKTSPEPMTATYSLNYITGYARRVTMSDTPDLSGPQIEVKDADTGRPIVVNTNMIIELILLEENSQ